MSRLLSAICVGLLISSYVAGVFSSSPFEELNSPRPGRSPCSPSVKHFIVSPTGVGNFCLTPVKEFVGEDSVEEDSDSEVCSQSRIVGAYKPTPVDRPVACKATEAHLPDVLEALSTDRLAADEASDSLLARDKPHVRFLELWDEKKRLPMDPLLNRRLYKGRECVVTIRRLLKNPKFNDWHKTGLLKALKSAQVTNKAALEIIENLYHMKFDSIANSLFSHLVDRLSMMPEMLDEAISTGRCEELGEYQPKSLINLFYTIFSRHYLKLLEHILQPGRIHDLLLVSFPRVMERFDCLFKLICYPEASVEFVEWVTERLGLFYGPTLRKVGEFMVMYAEGCGRSDLVDMFERRIKASVRESKHADEDSGLGISLDNLEISSRTGSDLGISLDNLEISSRTDSDVEDVYFG